MAFRFFSAEWAQEAKEAVNAGPSDEVRSRKLDKYWAWIDEAKKGLDCKLALAVRDLPEGPTCVLLELHDGVCSDATVVSRAEAEAQATYLLAGDLDSWREIMGGFDVGKTVMYRKLMLEQGEVLEFFEKAYFWTESLACIQRIPTEI